MDEDIVLKRKIYGGLLEWNADIDKVPLIVDGLRQVGKSYIVDKFAHENYENVITYDFRHRKELRSIFNGNLDVDSLIEKSFPYILNDKFVPNKTTLIFEETGDCPLARTSLKSFALDKRYVVIGTGSLNYRRKEKIEVPTGYEKIIHMSSLDFEEFLWTNGVDEKAISTLKEYIEHKRELPLALTNFYKGMIEDYVVIEGTPGSIKEFLKTNNSIKSREHLDGLIKDYRSDFYRFINKDGEEEADYYLQAKLDKVFYSIPS